MSDDWRDGDEYAAALLAHRPLLLRLATRLLRDPDEAEDAVQEAYLRAWRHREHAEAAHLGGWLCTILANHCRDRLRRRRHAPAVARSLDAPLRGGGVWADLLPDPAPEPGALLAGLAGEDALAALIRQLPPRQRAAVVLKDRDGLRNVAVAAALGEDARRVGPLLYRGHARLRRMMEA